MGELTPPYKGSNPPPPGYANKNNNNNNKNHQQQLLVKMHTNHNTRKWTGVDYHLHPPLQGQPARLGDIPTNPPPVRVLPPPPPLIHNQSQPSDTPNLTQHPLIHSQSPPTAIPNFSQIISAPLSGGNPPDPPAHLPPRPSTIGHTIPAITQKLQDKILAGEFIDFSELPPAKGKASPLSLPTAEGNIILVNAADLAQQKKLIPDLGTWIQCFTIYTGVICAHHPTRLPDLLSYQYQITRVSQRYRWPSWVIFDQNFRQMVADRGSTTLAHLDPTLFTQCFSGQAKENNTWCLYCHSLEHSSSTCSLRPPPGKRPKPSTADTAPSPVPQSSADPQICRNFNRVKGCRFGDRCYRIHRCAGCGKRHPVTKCPSTEGSSKASPPTPPGLT